MLQLNEDDLIGRGSFGNVYRSSFGDETVAVKKLRRDKISVQEAEILRCGRGASRRRRGADVFPAGAAQAS